MMHTICLPIALRFSVLLAGFLSAFSLQSTAQETYKGVIFENDLDWQGVLEKAASTNKHIFIDFYTTWCSPCKHIDKYVFPTEQAGNYFNERFVNIKIQLDKTPKDSEQVQRWYKQGDSLGKVFQIGSFPTFLVFSPQGEPLHRIVGAGDSIHLFISRIDEAFDPSRQYFTALKNLQQQKSPNLQAFKNLALQSYAVSHTSNARFYSDLYLEGLQGVYTKEDLEFAKQFNKDVKAVPFRIFLKESKKVNALMGEGYAEREVMEVIQKKEFYDTKMAFDSVVNWKLFKKQLKKSYGSISKQALQKFQLEHVINRKDWPAFQKQVRQYLNKFSDQTSYTDLDYYSLTIMRQTNSRSLLEQSLHWMEKAMAIHTDYTIENTYALILYKLGRKEEAITLQKKVLETSHSHRKQYFQKHLTSMLNGLPLWNVKLENTR